MGYIDNKPPGVLHLWSAVCHISQVGHDTQYMVPTAHNRIMWRFHHLLHLCQRKHTNVTRRKYDRILQLYRNKHYPWPCTCCLGILDCEIKLEKISFFTPKNRYSHRKNKKNAFLSKKKHRMFCWFKKKLYLCIAIEKQMHS